MVVWFEDPSIEIKMEPAIYRGIKPGRNNSGFENLCAWIRSGLMVVILSENQL
jgi:hypothetical protein